MRRAKRRQKHAVRPGTAANRKAAVKRYKAFAKYMGFGYKKPTPIQVCAYIERMVELGCAPGTIRNNISLIRSHLRLKSQNVRAFNSVLVTNAIRAVEMDIRHVKRQKDPVTPQILKSVIKQLSGQPNAQMITLALILMFEAFLRQSNLLPRSVSLFDKTRHMTLGDVADNGKCVTINIKWSKTQQAFGDHQVVNLYAILGSPLCPVTAYRKALRVHPRPRPSAPLISFTDGNPITLGYVKRVWGDALEAIKLSPKTYSLHSLRRGGASFCHFKQGAKLHDVKRHGGWRSDCVRAYLRPPPAHKDSVHLALAHL